MGQGSADGLGGDRSGLQGQPVLQVPDTHLNSSLAWLFRETTGRKNLGGGMLKAEATDMKALPIGFSFDFADEAKAVFNRLKRRAPLPLAQEICTDEHSAIDQMIFGYFGFSELLNDTREQLLNQVAFRNRRSSL